MKVNHMDAGIRTKSMLKKISLLVCAFCCIVFFCAPKPSYAIFLKLTPEQIQEAIEYGRKNKNLDIADFSKQWTVAQEKTKGFATLFTPYHNIAYKARKSAVERRDFTNKEIMEAIQIGDTLTFSVTVYGEEYDFAMHYSSVLYQKDMVIQPEFEFTPEIADASEFWPDSPSHSARLVFKFPSKDIDPNILVTFVVIAPGGEETSYDFDLSRMK